MEFSRIFTNFNQKLPKSPEISKMLGIIGVTGFPNYQLFRIIDNWGWGFGPEVGGVISKDEPSKMTLPRAEVRAQ